MAKILIVDDEPDVAGLIATTLEFAGHEGVTACSAKDAFERIEETTFDAILLDVRMPEVDGYDALRALHERPAFTTPVIMVTARGDSRGVMEEAMRGAIARVPKPFRNADLVATVDRVLSMSDEERRMRREMRTGAAETYGSVEEMRANLVEY